MTTFKSTQQNCDNKRTLHLAPTSENSRLEISLQQGPQDYIAVLSICCSACSSGVSREVTFGHVAAKASGAAHEARVVFHFVRPAGQDAPVRARVVLRYRASG